MERFGKSLRNAYSGLKHAVYNERNFRIELVMASFVLLLIFFFKVKSWEAIILVLMIMWVLISELTNTVVEMVTDILKPRIHPYARIIKDIMATVVMISSLVAMIVGIIIFLPYVREFFGR